MKINDYEFSCFKRVFMENDSEFWRSLFLDEKGLIIEDNIIILWGDPVSTVVLFSDSQERMKSLEYLDLILGLFHDVTEFEFKTVFQEKPCDNRIEDQIILAKNTSVR